MIKGIRIFQKLLHSMVQLFLHCVRLEEDVLHSSQNGVEQSSISQNATDGISINLQFSTSTFFFHFIEFTGRLAFFNCPAQHFPSFLFCFCFISFCCIILCFYRPLSACKSFLRSFLFLFCIL